MEDFRRHFQSTLAVKKWKIRLSMVFVFAFYMALWIFGMMPITKSIWAEFHKLCWVVEILAVAFYVIYTKMRGMGAEYSVDSLMTSVLFLTQIFAHLAILWDSFCMRKKRALLHEKFKNLDLRLLECNLVVSFNVTESTTELTLVLLKILIQLIFWNSFISWTASQVNTTPTALYRFGFLSTVALQLRMLEFLIRIATVNARLSVVYRNINIIGERNLRRIFKLPNKFKSKVKKVNKFLFEHSYFEEDDERQLRVLKSVLNDIFCIFQIINECYGWSLLAFTSLYFIDFVTNSYWIVLSMITQARGNLAFIQNIGFLWIVVVMLSTVCWHCQKSSDFSRQIGCLIFKLVKPLGNKRYNDLVNEFSLQTMHQQFVITAKEFFSLNLNLLGSMVAAIVTYLVILIQFMFTEKSHLERSIATTTARGSSNITSATMVTEALLYDSMAPANVKNT